MTEEKRVDARPVVSETEIERVLAQYDDSPYGVYAADVRTNEIVYANRVICSYMDLANPSQIIGKKCYQVLHLNSLPCAACCRDMLNQDTFHEWEYYNPLRNKSFLIRNKLVNADGKTYQLGILEKLERSEKENRFSNYEKSILLVNEMFGIALYKENPNQSISVVLEYLGKSLVADRAYIGEYQAGGSFRITYEWCRLGVKSLQEDGAYSRMELLWNNEATFGKPVLIADMETAKSVEPGAYQDFHVRGIHSLVMSPLRRHHTVSGFFVFENPDPDKIAGVALVLQTVENFLASLIVNRELFKRLEKSANVDSLTGLLNRHALDQILGEIDPAQGIGVLFCDLCGLKDRNDRKGHDAGDDMLCTAADVLRESFPHAQILRYGGDEFLVLAENMPEGKFLRAKKRAREKAASQKAPLAIGSAWRMNAASSEIYDLIHIADQRMYLDKEHYYSLLKSGGRFTEIFTASSLIESAPVSVMIYDRENRIIRSNKMTWQLFECSSELEFMTFSKGLFRNLAAPEDREQIDALMRYLERHNGQMPRVTHCHVVTKTGKRVQVEVRSELMTYADGGEYVNCTLSDGEKGEIQNTQLYSYETYDRLTGLLKQEAFFKCCDQLLRDADRENEGGRYSFIYFNIRNFKIINIDNRTQDGDRALLRLSQLIKEYTDTGVAGRLGGDHFVAVLQATEAEEKIRSIVSDFNLIYRSSGIFLKVGIYLVTEIGEQAAKALDLAKFACDSIRDTGDDMKMYDAVLDKKRALDSYVSSHLEEAMQKGWIKVYYQPVIRTINGAVCGVEALARWIDPVKGFLSPAEFIPTLEKNLQITKLDLYVLRELCKEMKETEAQGMTLIPVSVNLSRLDFLTCDIFREVERVVKEYRVSRDMINVEVTESMMAENLTLIRNALNRFRNAGYQVWMDDFGSGYSSLNILQQFEFDEIKLDMMFMRNFSEKNKNIVRSIISMAKMLGIRTLTEGVETREQYEFLRKIGCERMQGYYFGRPQPQKQLLQTLEQKQIFSETKAFRVFYDRLDGINFMTDKAMAVAEFDGENYRYLFLNDDYRKVLDSTERNSMQEVLDSINSPVSSLSFQLRAFQKTLKAGGDFQTFDYTVNGRLVRLRMKLISELDGHYLDIFEITNITQLGFQVEQGRIEDVMRTLYTQFDSVYVYDLSTGEISPVMAQNARSFLQDSVMDEHGRINGELLADRYIFKDDKKAFLEFVDMSAGLDRMKKSPRGYLANDFRTKNINGAYVWKTHVVQYEPKNNSIIYATRYNPILQDGVLERAMPEYMASQSAENLLWYTLLKSRVVNLFWKDKNRRFLGANASFLQTYGLKDESEIIGKTDEDMEWHVQNGPFQREEQEVLENGKVIRAHLGKSFIRGVLHNIIATKEPIYQNGEIVGLIGNFLIADDLVEASDRMESILLTDMVTGLLSPQGMFSATADFVENWETQGENFAVANVDFEIYQGLITSCGEALARRILAELGGRIKEEIGSFREIHLIGGRLYADRFVFVARYNDKRTIYDMVQYLCQKWDSIHEILDIPITLNPKVTLHFAENELADNMIAYATGRAPERSTGKE